MQVRQLDGVADRLDLAGEPADVGVVDVGHLLEHEVGDLGLGDALEDEAGARLEQQGVAGPDGLALEGCRDPADPLLVGLGDDEHPAVVEDLLAEHDLAGGLVAVRGNDVHRLVEHDLAARHELALLEGRADRDVHLAAAGEDVGGAVVEGLDDDAVGRRGLGQPVDLGLEGDDLLAGVAQGAHEALVLGGHRGELGAQTGEVALEGAQLRRRALTTGPQRGDLGLERLPLGLEALAGAGLVGPGLVGAHARR